MQSREIISLQLGHYSNFVGTHIWNLQEACFSYNPNDTKIPLEFNHDVFYREGTNPRGKLTYTPRLVTADLRGSLKTLQQEGSLHDPLPSPAKEQICWSGKVAIHKTEPEKNLACSASKDEEEAGFSQADEDKDVCRSDLPPGSRKATPQHLENCVEVWSDFLRVKLHPRSVNVVQGYCHGDKEDPFDLYGLGLQVSESAGWQEGYLNHVRHYAEECDSLQAFNLLFDAYDGFSGLAAGLLEHIRDEYPGKRSLCWPLFQPYYPVLKEERAATEASIRHFNAVLSYDSLFRLSSAFCPLSISESHFEPVPRTFRHVSFSARLPYHTSAVLAAPLDSLFNSLKLKGQPLNVPELLGRLTGLGRKVLALGSAFPLGLPEDRCIAEWKDRCTVSPLTPKVPAEVKPSDRSTAALGVVRGLPKAVITRAPARIEDPEERLLKFVDGCCYNGLMLLQKVQNPTWTRSPFPCIFDTSVSRTGFICRDNRRSPVPGVDQAPSLTTLYCNEGLGETLREVVDTGSKVRQGRLHRCAAAGTETDAFNEALNGVQDLASAYES